MHNTQALELRAAARKLSAADFAGTVRSCYPFWDTQYRPMLLQAVQALPASQFHFKPHPALLTAHQVILHIAEAERAWMHSIVNRAGEVEEWVVPHADPAQGLVTVYDAPDHAALLGLLEKWHRVTKEWLDKPASELSRVIHYTPPELEPRTYTLHWILDHLQEHELHHRAHLNLYLRMMGVDPPSI